MQCWIVARLKAARKISGLFIMWHGVDANLKFVPVPVVTAVF